MKRQALETAIPRQWRLNVRHFFRWLPFVNKVPKLHWAVRAVLKKLPKDNADLTLQQVSELAESIAENADEITLHKKSYDALLEKLGNVTTEEYVALETTLYNVDSLSLDNINTEKVNWPSYWKQVLETQDDDYLDNCLLMHKANITQADAANKLTLFQKIINSKISNDYCLSIYSSQDVLTLITASLKIPTAFKETELLEQLYGLELIYDAVLRFIQGPDKNVEKLNLINVTQHKKILLIIAAAKDTTRLNTYYNQLSEKIREDLRGLLRKDMADENQDTLKLLPFMLTSDMLPELNNTTFGWLLNIYYDNDKQHEINRWDARGTYEPKSEYDNLKDNINCKEFNTTITRYYPSLKMQVLSFIYKFATRYKSNGLWWLLKNVSPLPTTCRRQWKTIGNQRANNAHQLESTKINQLIDEIDKTITEEDAKKDIKPFVQNLKSLKQLYTYIEDNPALRTYRNQQNCADHKQFTNDCQLQEDLKKDRQQLTFCADFSMK